jgi:mono/diheme cytochrome c family protein
MKRCFAFLLILPLAIACQRTPPPMIEKTPAAAAPDPGESLYLKYCMACHQADGSGVPGMYPPIQSTDWVQGGKDRLIGLLLKGQQGEIEVNGKPFRGIMPAHTYLTDNEIAEVLTYVRSHFGNQADAVTPEEVQRLRAENP